MRTTRRGRLIEMASLGAALLLSTSAGCNNATPPASGSTTYSPYSPMSPGTSIEELPDTPAPLEELGTVSEPEPEPVHETPAPETDAPQGPQPALDEEDAAPAATDSPSAAANPFPVAESTPVALRNVPESQGRLEDWTSFRNGLELRGIAGSALPDEPELLWEVPTEHGTRSTAAIRDGRAYIGILDGYVLCLDLRTGDEFWRYRSIESSDPDEFAPGFNAPTTLSDEAVFIGDEDGVFHAIDRGTGEQLWTFETQGEIVGGASLLPENRVMFGSHDGRLYCLARDTGEMIWEFEALGPINGTQAVYTSRPAAEPAPTPGEPQRFTFVTGCDKPTLRVVDTATGEQVSEIPLGEMLLIASPALVGDALYFGTDSGEVVALDWQTQTTNWVYTESDDPNQINSSPAVTDDAVIIGSRDRSVHCIDRETGERRWAFETRGWVDGSPVVVGNRVFFGSNDMNLYAVNIEDGSQAWQYQAGQRIAGSPAVGEGYLVIGAEQREGRIMCFGAPAPG